MSDLVNWYSLIGDELAENGESWSDVIHCTLSTKDLLVEFDDGYGSEEGNPFTAWTSERVYFPAVYDGLEWCASVPRDPCNEPTGHVGG